MLSWSNKVTPPDTSSNLDPTQKFHYFQFDDVLDDRSCLQFCFKQLSLKDEWGFVNQTHKMNGWLTQQKSFNLDLKPKTKDETY